jgi:hypothetical protein
MCSAKRKFPKVIIGIFVSAIVAIVGFLTLSSVWLWIGLEIVAAGISNQLKKGKRHQWRLLTAKIGVLTTTVTMIVMIFAVAVAEGLSPTRQE